MPLQNLMEKLPSRDQAMGSLQELLSNPRVASMLLAGAGGGLVGGAMSARSPRRRGESRGARRRRILRDALLTAGAGAGAVGLGQFGYDQLNTVLPARDPEARGGRTLLGTAGFAGAGAGAGWGLKGRNTQLDSANRVLKTFPDDRGFAEALKSGDRRRIVRGAKQVIGEKGDALKQLNPQDIRNVGGRGLEGLYDDAAGAAGKAYDWLAGSGKSDTWNSIKGNLGGKQQAVKGILSDSNLGRGAKADRLARGGAKVLHRNARKALSFAGRHPRTAGAAMLTALGPTAWEHGIKPLGQGIGRSIEDLMTYGDD